MTCIEKWKQCHPDEDEKVVLDNRCPMWTFDIEEPDYCGKCYDACERCWNREIPGTEGDSIFITGDKDGGMAVTNTGYEFWQDGEAKIKLECTDPTPVIKDSGTRREFDTGAVRDIQEGKGRCDLMPLDVVVEITGDPVIAHIANFMETGDRGHLRTALDVFAGSNYPDMLLEVAKHFEEGAKKYGENNWQKGIPVRCYIDSAVRHYLKFQRGDKDEPHNRAFCWNIITACWTCKHKPELNDYAVREETPGQMNLFDRKENHHADN